MHEGHSGNLYAIKGIERNKIKILLRSEGICAIIPI